MARPVLAGLHSAAAWLVRKVRMPGSSTDASPHPVAGLLHRANPGRPYFDSACALDLTTFETPRIALWSSERHPGEACIAETQPTESPSTKLQHTGGGKSVPRRQQHQQIIQIKG